MKLKNIVFSILKYISAISLTQAEDVSFSQEQLIIMEMM